MRTLWSTLSKVVHRYNYQEDVILNLHIMIQEDTIIYTIKRSALIEQPPEGRYYYPTHSDTSL